MTDHKSFRGLHVPMVTPLNERTMELDKDAIAAFAAHLESQPGVSGVVTSARIGEGPLLSVAEQAELVRIVRSSTDRRTVITATISAATAADAITQTKKLASVGADAVMIFPPLFFAWGAVPSAVKVEYFKAVSSATDLPIVLFQIPVRSYWFTPTEVREIFEIETVLAMKEASFSMDLFSATMKAIEDIGDRVTVMNGNDRFVAEGAVMGATGALIGIANLLPSRWAAMIDAALANDVHEALRIQKSLEGLQDTVFADPILDAVARIKYLLAEEGIIPNSQVRPPQLGIGDAERKELLRAYREASTC